MTSSTTNYAKPLNHYVQGDRLFAQLETQYGAYFENLDREWQLIFRASLSTYLVIQPIWVAESSSITCVECCIAGAGGDDYDIWDKNPILVEHIQEACENLSDQDIEGLIEFLTAQLRGG